MNLFGRVPQADPSPGVIVLHTLTEPTPSQGMIGNIQSQDHVATERFANVAKVCELSPAQTAIVSEVDMTKVPFEACLNAELQLLPHANALVAVLATDSSKKTAIILASQITSESILTGVVAVLKANGIALLSNACNCYQASAPVLTAVVNGNIAPRHMRVHRSVAGNAEQSALWQAFVSIIDWAFQRRANDIDFRVDFQSISSSVYFKIDGQYITLDRWHMPTETLVAMLAIAYQKSAGGADTKFEPAQEQQCRIEITLSSGTRLRLRWASMSTDKGCTITMRIQRLGAAQTVLTLEDAGFLPTQIDALMRAVTGKGGLTTFAGTVGSGKSVTLAILMRLIDKNLKGISIEDPVEIEIEHMIQKTVTRDLLSDDDRAFQAAVVTLFRSALDYLMIGEVRDVSTARVVRSILESGHSCFTTTHAISALGVFTKFASPQVGIPMDLLATPGMIRLNVFQALLPTLCTCALDAKAFIEQLRTPQARRDHLVMQADIQTLYDLDPHSLRYRNPHGCPCCKAGQEELPTFWGLAGRTVVAEMVEPDEYMCELLQKADMVGLTRYWKGMSDGDITSENTLGKTAMDVAMHKVAKGLIDPITVQMHLENFRTLASKSNANKRLKAVS